MTDPQKLRALLDRYEAAETSVAEERELKALLQAADLPAEFAPYQQWFGIQTVIQTAKSTKPFAEAPWLAPTKNGADHGKQPQLRVVSKRSGLKARPKLRIAIAAAVMLAVVMTAGFFFLSNENSLTASQPIASNNIVEAQVAIDWSKYEITDPEEATRITRAALSNVSRRIENGSRITSKEVGRMEPINNVFNSKS
ncbi:MAG: hypothetical protein AB8F78_10550 [Saprospiraceae bacterium]